MILRSPASPCEPLPKSSTRASSCRARRPGGESGLPRHRIGCNWPPAALVPGSCRGGHELANVVLVTARTEVLLIGGRCGVGKSIVGSEIHAQLSAAGVWHCLIEGDNLDMCPVRAEVALSG
jgi:hypothetical protein